MPQVVLLALWLGASAFLALVVAPTAFAALPSRAEAGELVGRVLPILFWVGAATGVAVLGLDLLGRELRFRPGRAVAAGAVVVACLAAQVGIAPRISALRATMTAPLAALPVGDPQRIMFGRLHMWSVAGLGVAILAALVALTLAVIILRSRART